MVSSVAHRAKTVAGSIHWSPLTVVIPNKSICGARRSMSSDKKLVPWGPALSWSAMTLIFLACAREILEARKQTKVRMKILFMPEAPENPEIFGNVVLYLLADAPCPAQAAS